MPQKSKPRNHSTLAVLTTLHECGVSTVASIHKRVGARKYTLTAIRQTVTRLRGLGMIRRTNGHGPGREGLYMITKKGIAKLQ